MQKEHRITERELLRLAELAEWEPSEEERAALAADLAEMLQMLADLDSVEDATPAAAAVALCDLRADAAAPSLSREEALANAPDRRGEYIAVPRVVE